MMVLVVEDNEVNLDMLVRRLKFRGYDVETAGDGAAAVAKVRSERPDIVLMDMSLPVMDGWQATKELKADATTRSIPIIALTAHALREDREKAIAAGCDGFHSKPIDMDALVGLMKELGGTGS